MKRVLLICFPIVINRRVIEQLYCSGRASVNSFLNKYSMECAVFIVARSWTRVIAIGTTDRGKSVFLIGARVSRSDREGVIRRGHPELAESFVDIIVTVDAYAMISILEQPRDKTRGHEGCSRCSRMGRRSIPAVTLPCLRKNPCIR